MFVFLVCVGMNLFYFGGLQEALTCGKSNYIEYHVILTFCGYQGLFTLPYFYEEANADQSIYLGIAGKQISFR